jgi:hypothetical protein
VVVADRQTGRPAALTAVIVQEVHDGRITVERHYLELLKFMVQVGLLETD